MLSFAKFVGAIFAGAGAGAMSYLAVVGQTGFEVVWRLEKLQLEQVLGDLGLAVRVVQHNTCETIRPLSSASARRRTLFDVFKRRAVCDVYAMLTMTHASLRHLLEGCSQLTHS